MLIRRAAVPLLTALTTLLAAGTAVAAPQPHERRGPATVTFATTGWGHGIGLSQYGARNRATAGQSYRTIIKHYYPGTSLGHAHGSIRVQITADTSRNVVVRPRTGLKVRSLGAKKAWRLPAKVHGKRVVAWKIDPAAAGHRSRVSYKVRTWHSWRTPRGDAEFTAGGGPIVLSIPGGHATYRGVLRSSSVNASGTSRDTVNVLSLDAYVRGVVAREVPPSWPAAALRAQAVAARTYAAYERRANRGSSYDICDTDRCQVYGGYDDEHPRVLAAVRATAGTVVMYAGRTAFTQFSASNGGWSVAGSFPYLKARKDPFDHGTPGDPATRTFKAAAIARNWPGLGDLVSIEVTGRDGHGPDGGRVTEVTVTGTGSTVTATGEQLRSWLGLRSTLFRITSQ